MMPVLSLRPCGRRQTSLHHPEHVQAVCLCVTLQSISIYSIEYLMVIMCVCTCWYVTVIGGVLDFVLLVKIQTLEL